MSAIYFIRGGENLKDLDRLDYIFKKRGNWQIYNRGKDIDFSFLKNVRDSKYWDQKSVFSNAIMDIRKFFNKGVFEKRVKEFDKKLSKYILDSKTVNIYHFYKNPKLLDKFNPFEKIGNYALYLKPVTGSGGSNIRLIINKKQFIQSVEDIITENKKDWQEGSQDFRKWVLQDYYKPNDMCLYEKKKFHFRAHFIMGKTKSGVKMFIHKKFPMAIARKNFSLDKKKTSDFTIHDTHYKFGITGIFLENFIDKKKLKLVTQQLKEFFSVFKDNFNIKCFEENKYCYKILGADVILYNDYTIKIIEINTSPSFKDNDWLYDILDGVMYHYVDEVYPPTLKFDKFDNFMQI